jgi:hypothetical protein
MLPMISSRRSTATPAVDRAADVPGLRASATRSGSPASRADGTIEPTASPARRAATRRVSGGRSPIARAAVRQRRA